MAVLSRFPEKDTVQDRFLTGSSTGTDVQERQEVPAAACAALKAPTNAHVTRSAVPKHA